MGKSGGSPSSARGAHPPANGRGHKTHNGRKGSNKHIDTYEDIDNLEGDEIQKYVKERALDDDPVYCDEKNIQYRCEVRC